MGTRLDSWKEIAAYLKRGPRTVQRWEAEEGLPVHRLPHAKLGSVYAYAHELDQWWAGRAKELEAEAAPKAAGASVAVLPFADMSEEGDQVYFCEGVAEEIINALGRVSGLRATSRTASFRFRDAGSTSREIGRQLRVRSLLEGSVRKSGGRLRIGVRLTEAESGFQLWSTRFDRDAADIFAIQDEIARNVAAALQVTLSPAEKEALGKPPTQHAQAYDLYLRARQFYYLYSPRAMEFALQLFSRAIEADPSYARAYAGQADCWSYLYLYSDRREEVRRKAEEASRKAMEMNPASAQALASRGLSYSVSGRVQEAEQAFEEALRLDSELFETYYFYARHSFAQGNLAKAIRLYEEAVRVNPDDFQCRLLMAQSYEVLGRNEEARATRRRGVELAALHLELNPDDARALYMAANGLVALGEKEQGREWAERALAMQPEDPMLLYNVGCIFSMLGLAEQAMGCLERAERGGLREAGWYEHDSNLDAVRGHPRFQALLKRLR
ncbi:MAG: tetratricopeptide repeat protein [Bryobacterales bacterium]|nr:tetratricopeptide repeat protein [Bryobacterales bacterium]